MNKVILMGRLTRDPDVRYSQGANQTAVARYSLAVDRRFRRDGDPEADFINCVAWGRQADNVSKYCKKGALVSAEGRIQTRSYDGQDGNKRYVTEVNCDRINFLTPKGDSQSNDYASSMPSNEEMANMAPDNNMDSVDLSEDPFKSFGEEITLSSDALPF